MQSLNPIKPIQKILLSMQQDEINNYHTYKKLALLVKDPANSQVIFSIANAELKHYGTLKAITHQNIKPQGGKINVFVGLCRVFGLTFGIC